MRLRTKSCQYPTLVRPSSASTAANTRGESSGAFIWTPASRSGSFPSLSQSMTGYQRTYSAHSTPTYVHVDTLNQSGDQMWLSGRPGGGVQLVQSGGGRHWRSEQGDALQSRGIQLPGPGCKRDLINSDLNLVSWRPSSLLMNHQQSLKTEPRLRPDWMNTTFHSLNWWSWRLMSLIEWFTSVRSVSALGARV